jgi:hypothetical protein
MNFTYHNPGRIENMDPKIYGPLLIPKEEVLYLHFPSKEVLGSIEEIRQRKMDAKKGLLMGNSDKLKVRITFEDSQSIKQVHTTIWGLTEEHVILKRGIAIPLNCIYKIDLCP